MLKTGSWCWVVAVVAEVIRGIMECGQLHVQFVLAVIQFYIHYLGRGLRKLGV